ncbi:MAG: twin-arginine translocase TatA/TatE family subunit [Ktedonobacterales bacterium]
MGHWFEILLLLGVGLLVFGPKRMVEMGSQFGKMFREFQGSLKEMNWSLTGNTDDNKPAATAGDAITKLSEYAQNILTHTGDDSALDRNSVESLPATPVTTAAPLSEKVVEPTAEEAAKSALN